MPRPFILDPLFRSLITLPGIGAKTLPLMNKLLSGIKILDLLYHKPVDIIDRRHSPAIDQAEDGKIVTLTLTIDHITPSQRRQHPTKVKASNDTGDIDLVFFNLSGEWIKKQLPIGETRVISGKLERFQGKPQIVNPDRIGTIENRAEIETLDPIYPLTAGLTIKTVQKALKAALEQTPDLPEWLDPAHQQQNGWQSWRDSVHALHTLDSADILSDDHPVRRRLAYDELLANQLALALVRQQTKKTSGQNWNSTGEYRAKLLKQLPFELTGAQQFALTEIDDDMRSPHKMLRLLQGDVGSGKTIVAAAAMLNVIEGGAQAAIMAPTEVLARQHAESFLPWLEPLGIKAVPLTGRNKGKERAALMAQITDGSAQIVIGTHALFQDSVSFHHLGLAVIDEQHRFGVQERLKLSSKNKGVDTLVMTATPIPRTLTLTAYGDMDVSRLNEKPPGRQPIDTRLLPKEKIDSMIARLKSQIAGGTRAYWVCPLVEESEILDLEAAEARYDILRDHFGDRVGLVHGRMKPAEKDAVMAQFASGAISVLVATTVIEVGVNVPEATIMIIEHAERFGLAQLHQLRGRVGRGSAQSYCFLVYPAGISQTAQERLKIMRETEDGFIIAEKDLELRGGGEILGTRQSGLPKFKLAVLPAHNDLLATAHDDVKLILSRDPALQNDRGQALRTLLYLFEKDRAIKLLQAG